MNKTLKAEFHYTTGGIEELTREGDASNFRWIRGSFGVPAGMNYLDKQTRNEGILELTYIYFNDLALSVTRSVSEKGIEEQYVYKNNSKKPITLTHEEYGVSATFADGYDIAEVALPRRAYCRVFCGSNSMCVYNARINGATDGVGLVLTSGELGGFTTEKHGRQGNTEHMFLLPEKTLEPEESFSFSWLLFAFDGKEDFLSIISQYMPTPHFSTLNPIPNQEVVASANGAELFIDGKPIESDVTIKPPCVVKAVKEGKELEFTFSANDPLDSAEKAFKPRLFHKKNPFTYIKNSYASLNTYKQTEDKGYCAIAVMELISYFTHANGNRRFDRFLPIEVIKQSDELKAFLLARAEGVLLSDKKIFSPTVLLAKYEILCLAMQIEERAEFKQKAEELKPLCLAYIQTPFGNIE